MAAENERVMVVTLVATLGREPTDEEVAAAREVAIQDRLRGRLGRPPTDAEADRVREMAINAYIKVCAYRWRTE